jgi:hypothetical protein
VEDRRVLKSSCGGSITEVRLNFEGVTVRCFMEERLWLGFTRLRVRAGGEVIMLLSGMNSLAWSASMEDLLHKYMDRVLGINGLEGCPV